MRRAVFLDRDGVLAIPEFRDGRSFAATSLAKFVLYDDVYSAVAQLKDAGFVVVVVTNQPDVARGVISQEEIEAMHDVLRTLVPIDDIEVSYDPSGSVSRRRKPNPGMLFDAAEKWAIDLMMSYMVGDRAIDIEAGNAAGCRCVFIDRGYAAECAPTGHVAAVSSLSEAVVWILSDSKSLSE